MHCLGKQNRTRIADVKSRLLPLAPSVVPLEYLIESLPRTLVEVQLRAANDIAIMDSAIGSFKATGNNPWFELTLTPAARGWYYLEAALVRNNGSRQAHIHVEVDADPAHDMAVPITTNLRGSVREVFYLPANVRRLRWAPTAAAGSFSQSPLLLHRISAVESFCRRCSRVLFDLWRFRSQTGPRRAGLSLWRALLDLNDAYRRSAVIRAMRAMGYDYQAFLGNTEALNSRARRAIARSISAMARRPLFSIIVTLDSPAPQLLARTLAAVTAQYYPNWELCLVGRDSMGVALQELIVRCTRQDARVRFSSLAAAGDEASLFNHGLAAARGAYVLAVKQHDLLQPAALFCVAQKLASQPDRKLIYSDEDRVDEFGDRTTPLFKPDWNPDLLYSHNYVSALCAYDRTLVTELGGYRRGYDGAEEYDLMLRCSSRLTGAQVGHVPRVLYSRHTAANADQQIGHAVASARDAGLRALREHLAPLGARAEGGPGPGLYRVRHPLPEALPLVSLIIPTRDQVGILRQCVESIRTRTTYGNWEMLIVDNQSVAPETIAYLDELTMDARIRVLKWDATFNYSALNNFAARFASGQMLALLNNDIEVIAPDWLDEMVSHAVRPGIGAVGAKLLYGDGTVQHAGVILGIGGVAGHVHKYLAGDAAGYCSRAILTQNLSAVTGACLVVRKAVYEEVGGLNEQDLVVAFNDIDFCLRLRAAGYRNLYTPYALLVHHESLSRGKDDTPEKRAVFQREFGYMKRAWGVSLNTDPAYNPNLTLEFENFTFTHARAHSTPELLHSALPAPTHRHQQSLPLACSRPSLRRCVDLRTCGFPAAHPEPGHTDQPCGPSNDQ